MRLRVKNKFLVLVLTILVGKIASQVNLVPNPGFEIYTYCPNSFSQLIVAKPWFSPSQGTSDYFNICAHYPVGVPKNFADSSLAHSGNAMAGAYIISDMDSSSFQNHTMYREYLAVKLSNTLIANQKYYGSFYVKLAGHYSEYACNQIGMFFKKDSISKINYDTISAVPQIANPAFNFVTSKTTWTKISGSFKATGNEKYLYIGNFHPRITNDTVYLNGNAPRPELKSIYYYIDDICVSTSSVTCGVTIGLEEEELSRSLNIYPVPASGSVDIEMENSMPISTIEVKNVHGGIMKELHAVNSKHYVLDISTFPDGMYFLNIGLGDRTVIKRIIKN